MTQATTPARGVHTTWLYTLGSVVFVTLALPALVLVLLVEAADANPSVAIVAVTVLTLASTIVAIRYCWFLRVGLGGGLPHPGWTAALLGTAGAAWAVGLFAGETVGLAAMPLWIGGSLIAALLGREVRWVIVAAGAAALVAHVLIGDAIGHATHIGPGPGTTVLIFYTLAFPLMVFMSLWWWDIVVTMDRHRAAAADLAVAEERLRFAADLHDIQGHHLQVIALKAELAERTLDRDPDAAREQVREVRLIAKEALEATRSLVAGYRDVDLAAELENARDVLSLTGAACTLTVDALPESADVRRALALVVREATTNILRHSSATLADIRLGVDAGVATLRIENDEAGEPAGDDASSSGLAGLRDRLAAVGGTLVSERVDDRFTLIAEVPATAEVTA